MLSGDSFGLKLLNFVVAIAVEPLTKYKIEYKANIAHSLLYLFALLYRMSVNRANEHVAVYTQRITVCKIISDQAEYACGRRCGI